MIFLIGDDNLNYFDKKNEMAYTAKLHTDFTDKVFKEEIKRAISNCTIYDKTPDVPPSENNPVEIKLVNINHESFIFSDDVKAYLDEGRRVCVHNFASYKSPGGLFLLGSTAQEECLCHVSGLYNVLRKFEGNYYLKNRRNLNRGLYKNVAIYSKDIPFFIHGEPNKTRSNARYLDVLTIAAPNASTMRRYKLFTPDENELVLKSRIEFIWKILAHKKVDIFITGAFGCGVFKQDPYMVADIMMNTIRDNRNYPKKVIFVIPDGENFSKFDEVISGYLKMKRSF